MFIYTYNRIIYQIHLHTSTLLESQTLSIKCTRSPIWLWRAPPRIDQLHSHFQPASYLSEIRHFRHESRRNNLWNQIPNGTRPTQMLLQHLVLRLSPNFLYNEDKGIIFLSWTIFIEATIRSHTLLPRMVLIEKGIPSVIP